MIPDEDDERASLEAVASRFGPFTPLASHLPPGGPARLWRAPSAIGWVHRPGRFRAEREGLALDHPARPELLEARAGVIVVPPFGAPLEDPTSRIIGWAEAWPVRETEASVRSHLETLAGGSALLRGLRQLGLPRRHLERHLDREVRVRTRVGPGLGGVAPGFLRHGAEGPVALRWDDARAESSLALELAGLALGGELAEEALSDAHAEALGGGEAPRLALRLALLVVRMREASRARDPSGLEEVAALIRASFEPPPPERVRVFIEAPSFVDVSRWDLPGAEVPAARARRWLRELDGTSVAGETLRVRTEPPLRPGRAPPRRETRASRQRRLFSRWSEGVRVDDEGLYSLTPEALAMRLARGASGVVVDGTAGVGGMAIAFARQPDVTKVVAIDTDPGRLEMLRHNAGIYGVANRIEPRVGDIVALARDLGRRSGGEAPTLLLLDPPWGGRAYDRSRVTLADLDLDVEGVLADFGGPVTLKLPRSFDPGSLPGGRGAYALELAVDDEGRVKFLVAHRR